jgi:hypothetical protein
LISGARNCARGTRYRINTGGSRPAGRLPLFACPKRESRKRAPRSWPACGGFPSLRNRRAGGKDSLRSVFRLLRPSAAPFRRRHKGDNGNAVIKQSGSAGVCNSLPPPLANRLRYAKALQGATDSVAWHRLIQDAVSGDSLCNGGSRRYVFSLLTFYWTSKESKPAAGRDRRC